MTGYEEDEFNDLLNELKERYNKIKYNLDVDSSLINQDITYMDSIVMSLSDYKNMTKSEYLKTLDEFSKSLYYFQTDTNLKYHIPLLQLIVFTLVFYNNCNDNFDFLFKR